MLPDTHKISFVCTSLTDKAIQARLLRPAAAKELKFAGRGQVAKTSRKSNVAASLANRRRLADETAPKGRNKFLLLLPASADPLRPSMRPQAVAWRPVVGAVKLGPGLRPLVGRKHVVDRLELLVVSDGVAGAVVPGPAGP